ncbi:MAG: S1C family serine protease [Promethearchaeota archaeon]
MYENGKNERVNYVKLTLVSVFIVAMFIAGFIFGGSYIYGITSPEIDELENQIELLIDGQYVNDNYNEIYNVTYFYNDTSLSDIYKEIKDSLVVISGVASYQTFRRTLFYEVQGSGFVYEFEDEFVVITNNHVVNDVSDIVVTFSNGNGYPAEVIGADAYSDLAVLSVDSLLDEFSPIKIVSSSYLEVGDPVIAIGNPRGLYSTMTTGIVSQIGRTIEESLAGNFAIANIIQTNVAINPGNSGGPLLNYQGEVVGITTAIVEDSEGLGFAIPSNTILREIESLIKTGSYDQHPWLGISGVDMSYSIAKAMDINVTYGWLITSVTSGSTAEKADLLGGDEQLIINNDWVIIGGDIIIALDETRIINGDALLSYLEEYTQLGQIITVTITRDSKQYNIPVEVGTRPQIS